MQFENQHEVPYTLIETQEQLEQGMMNISTAPWVAIDTEFIPEKRYHPLLCIIQIATPDENYIIDCKYVHDLRPFLSILQDENVVKITHAGKNDYEIFYEEYGILPKNVLDTQIAHSFIEGIPKPSLEFLLSHILDIDISKEEQNSDWWERPLTTEQTRYALSDVIYLHQLIEEILKRLHGIHRTEWAIQECQRLEDSVYYSKDEVLCFQKHKWVSYIDAEKFALLRKIIEWREEKAKQSNMPPDIVIKFSDIREILTSFFDHIESNNSVSNTIPDKHRKHHARFYQLYTTITNDDIENATKIQDQLPPNEQKDPKFHWKYGLTKLLVKYFCLQVNFRFDMVCTSSELLMHLWNQTIGQSILNRGWRKDLLGGSLLHLLGESRDFQVAHDDNVISLILMKHSLDQHISP